MQCGSHPRHGHNLLRLFWGHALHGIQLFDCPVAACTGLEGPVLPGMLLASLFPAIIGSRFPGAVYATQTLRFTAPALVGGACVIQSWWQHAWQCSHCRPQQCVHVLILCVQVGQTVQATVMVERCSGQRVTFNTQCSVAGSTQPLVQGTALALLPSGKGSSSEPVDKV